MSIVSVSNKQMLFDLLKSIGIENNLIINENQLQLFVNQQCGYFHSNRFEFDFGNDINEINKKIVKAGYNFIISSQPKQQNVSPPSSTTTGGVPQIIQKSNREIFDDKLENQETQFKKMINPKKPKKIDFTDGSKDFPMKNMETVINQTLEDRQREYSNITQKYSTNDKQKAQNWLNMNNNTPKIKIEKTSNLKLDDAVNVRPEKRVTFEIEERSAGTTNALDNLFLKLKQKKTISNNDIMDKLNIIISNQEKMMNLFFTIKGEKGDTGANGMPAGVLH